MTSSLLPSDPTHFTFILLSTSLLPTILSAALSHAGYSVLHLSPSPLYGGPFSSLSLSELLSFSSLFLSSSLFVSPSLLTPGHNARFSFSLEPILLRSVGPGIDLLVKSRVSSYLGFSLLGRTGIYSTTTGLVERVPGGKAEIFGDKSLGLVEKRRGLKFLLWAQGWEGGELPQGTPGTFVEFLKETHGLSPRMVDAIAFSLALCSTTTDPTLPSLNRLSALLRSSNKFGNSPLLVGHYGGAGDLIGGFSRCCAVWGGGQILGREIGELVLVDDSPSSSSTPTPSSTATPRPPALGIPVQIDEGLPPNLLTADFVITDREGLGWLFPSAFGSTSTEETVSTGEVGSIRTSKRSARGIFVIRKNEWKFPTSSSTSSTTPPPTSSSPPEEEEEEPPESTLITFPPSSLLPEMGTTTILIVGKETENCSEEFLVIYISGVVLEDGGKEAKELIEPFFGKVFSEITPSLSFTYFPSSSSSHSPSPPPSRHPLPPLPKNLILLPPLPCFQSAAALVDTFDQAALIAEEVFWGLVGGREGGVEWFGRRGGEEEEEE